MDKRTPLGFDTETHLFRAGAMAPRVVCVSNQLPGHAPELRDRNTGLTYLAGAAGRFYGAPGFRPLVSDLPGLPPATQAPLAPAASGDSAPAWA